MSGRSRASLCGGGGEAQAELASALGPGGWLAFLKGNLPSAGTSHLPTASAQASLPGLAYCYLAASPKGPPVPRVQIPGRLPPPLPQEPDSTPSRAREMLPNQRHPRGQPPILPTVRFFLPATPDGEGMASSRAIQLCPGSSSWELGAPQQPSQSLRLPGDASKARPARPHPDSPRASIQQ